MDNNQTATPQKSKILLIEDDTFIREMLQEEMERAGFFVTSVEKGVDGLWAVQQKEYDLVLLDIMLPDTNGLQVLRTIKTSPQTKNTRVVLLTNLGNDSLIKEGFDLGAIGYLVKAAYNPDQIIDEIKKFLTKHA